MTPDRIYMLLSKTGDLLSFLPALQQEAQEIGKPVPLMVSLHYADILDGCSYIEPIIFSGAPHELDKAVEQAKNLCKDVCCVQIAGPKELVWKHTFTPAGLSEQATDRFERLPWVVAGKGALWKEQPPLVFDRRDAAREAALWEPWKAKLKGKKPILVALGAESSPFPYSKLLWKLLELQFKGPFINLNEIKAERFYDMLVFYEKALCLIAADSAPLHLAHACPDFPVCALINDKPSLGHGSAWRANHISYIRYSDFPSRAIDLLDAVQAVRTGHWLPRWKHRTNVIHTYSCYEDGEDNARVSQRHNAPDWISTPIEVGACGSDSTVVLRDQKRMPFVKDVITLASYRAQLDDVIVLTRKDNQISLSESGTYSGPAIPCWSHRIVRDKEYRHSWHPSVDFFAFTKRWWREHANEYPNFYLGHDPHWHRVLMELLRKHGGVEVEDVVFRSDVLLRFSFNSPYVIHNERLAKQWLGSNGVTSLFPSVLKQVEAVTVNRRALFPNSYNPAIIRHEGRLLMAYRYHPNNSASTRLAMAELDEELNVTSNEAIEGIEGNSIEDPKLWQEGPALMLSWVCSSWPEKIASKVCFGELWCDAKWNVQSERRVDYGQNDGTGNEKNHVFFWHDGRHVIYQSQPSQIIIRRDHRQEDHLSKPLHWKWGHLKGGTAPVPYEGQLLRFFHSTLDNEPVPYRRRYYIGAMLMAANPPFEPLQLSSHPIIYGSEDDDLTETERASCGQYKPKVVFPGGVVPTDEGWLLSLGCNDSACVIAKLKPKDLHL